MNTRYYARRSELYSFAYDGQVLHSILEEDFERLEANL